MTVFKGFMTLVKRNIFMFFLYLGIFMSVCIMIQFLTKGEGMNHFEEESLDIAVIDRDGGELARGLTEYLGERHNLVDIEDNEDVIQESLFYRNIYYLVTIPEDFEEKCLTEAEKIKTTKIPGASTTFYVDQQIDTFLNDVRIFKKAGFSTEDAIAEVQRIGTLSTDVTLIDKNGHGGQMAPHAFMFQYLPYMILSVYVISSVLL